MKTTLQILKRTGLVCLLLILSPYKTVMAQQTGALPAYKTGVSVSYFGDLITHPGAVVSVEQSILPGRYQLVGSLNLGGYIHKRNHTALFTNLQIGQRYRFRSGFYLEQFVGLGYFRSYLNGDGIYEVSSTGVASQAANPGRGYVMPIINVGAGWDLSHRRNAIPLRLFVRPTLFWQAPFNGYSLPHLALQVGATKLIP